MEERVADADRDDAGAGMSEAARLLLTWREWLCIALSVILIGDVVLTHGL
jgi:hypothetical protein